MPSLHSERLPRLVRQVLMLL